MLSHLLFMHRWRIGWLAFLFFVPSLFAADTTNQPTEPDLKSLYDRHQWFELRDALQGGKVPELYQGAVAVAFGDARRAEKLLRRVIKAAPQSDDADQARAWLISLYSRSGHYQQALAMADERVAAQPGNHELKNQRAFIAAIARYPEQEVTRRRRSVMHFQKETGGIYIPVSINGRPANYLVDTAADLCLINESEAGRLGITVHTNDAKATGAGGAEFGFATAMAARFEIGGVHLKNVVFYVIPDGQLPFSDSSADKQGILGSAILQALETVRWKLDGTFEAAFPSEKRDTGRATLCFDSANPITEVEFRRQKFAFVLDTGSFETVLYAPFANKFESWLRETAMEGYTSMLGFGGNPKIHCVTEPEMKLGIAGLDTVLRPAKVLLEPTTPNSNYYFGLLGMNLLNQAHEVIIDYKSMTFSVN